MKLLRPFLLILSTIATCAHSAVVRTGDHGDFVRIVIQSNDKAKLSVTSEPGRIIVQNSSEGEDFDTSRFFQRIDTSIVDNLRVAEDIMVVNLTCNCSFDVFNMAPNLTVIDISKDTSEPRRPIPRNEPENENRDLDLWRSSIDSIDEFLKYGSPVPSITERSGENKAAQDITSGSQLNKEKIDGEEREPLQLPILFPQTEGSSASRFSTVIDTPATSRNERISNIEDLARQLSSQVGRAATQGILSQADRVENLQKPLSADENGSEEVPSEEEQDAQLFGVSGQAHMVVQNPISQFSFSEHANNTSVTCDDHALFEIETWSNSDNYIEDVAELRKSLYSEFDRVDEVTLERLIKANLFFGFGAEAAQLLEISEKDSKEYHAFRVIADVIDDTGEVAAFPELSGCESNISLWAILSTKSGKIAEPNVKAALLALNTLPYHLRQVLAPKLSKNLRSAGYLEEASQALRSLRLESENPSSDINIARSEVLLSNGEIAKARAEFETVSKQNASESPKALTKFLEIQNSTNTATSNDLLALAEAYLTELRGSEIRSDLQSAYIEALGVKKDYSRAIKIILEGDLSQEETRRIIAKVSMIVLNEESDFDFLTYAAKLGELADDLRDPLTDIAMSERFVELGFPGLAREMFGDTISASSSPDAQLLRARIHFAMGEYAEALEEVSELPAEQSNELRAQVAFETGDYALASRIFREIGQSENAERSSLRVPADGIDIESAQEFLPTETSNLRKRQFLEPLNGTLESNRSLAEDTASLSSEISELLSSPELKVANDPS